MISYADLIIAGIILAIMYYAGLFSTALRPKRPS
jgi:TRAP-type uncharacterized transport system fused permease subunit